MTKIPAPAPTLAAIGKALDITVRRVSALKLEGLPTDSIEAALAWRKAREGGSGDSAELLRQARIKLVEAQREKVNTENQVRRGNLVDVGEVLAAGLSVAAATRSALLQLANDLPPRLEGLTASAIGKVLRAAHVRILNELSQGRWMDSPEVLAIIELARREAKLK